MFITLDPKFYDNLFFWINSALSPLALEYFRGRGAFDPSLVTWKFPKKKNVYMLVCCPLGRNVEFTQGRNKQFKHLIKYRHDENFDFRFPYKIVNNIFS